MRDPERLNGFYNYLKTVHKKVFPDWRFGQLITNLIKYHGDIFYLEEEDFLKALDNFVKEIKGKK